MNFIREAESGGGGEEPFKCEVIGEGMADIAGIGVIVGFVGQAALSLLLASWVFFISKMGWIDKRHDEGTMEHRIECKRLENISEILMIGNDMQMTLGLSYLVTVYASRKEMDLYHLHLVFDIVAFVGVSSAAAMVCWTFCQAKNMDGDYKWASKFSKTQRVSLLSPRHRVMYIFMIMFTVLTIYLGVALNEWAPEAEPGRCYISNGITSPSAMHPTSDKIYVAITASWLLLVMAASILLKTHHRRYILIAAFLQFPVHLYMTLVLRHNQQHHLDGEEKTEDAWDFGQTTAVVLLNLAIAELFSKAWRYYRWERKLRHNNGVDPDDEMELNKLASIRSPRVEEDARNTDTAYKGLTVTSERGSEGEIQRLRDHSEE